MAGERYVALGLATARSPWFTNVARWATVGSLPLEFVKCIDADELRARLGTGRPFSAVLVDAATGDVDRDLVELATARGASLVVVEDGRSTRDWRALGARAVLPPSFGRQDLLDVLGQVSRMIGGATELAVEAPGAPSEAQTRGTSIAVTGRGGVGTSTVAMALAQGLADDDRLAGHVLLADLRLDADLAMLHDARDIVPGVQELVEAHRRGRPTAREVRGLTFDVANRRYRLLLGLRRHRDWTALRPRAVDEALVGLRRSFRFVVCDVDPDLEGQDETGSVEVEERNVLARRTVATADAVVAVGLPGVKGVHGLVRVVADLRAAGVHPARIVPVVNRAPRNPRTKAELGRTIAELSGRHRDADHGGLAGPLFLPERRGLDDLHRDGARLPAPLTGPLATAVHAVLGRAPAATASTAAEPARVTPGTLGSWYEEEAG